VAGAAGLSWSFVMIEGVSYTGADFTGVFKVLGDVLLGINPKLSGLRSGTLGGMADEDSGPLALGPGGLASGWEALFSVLWIVKGHGTARRARSVGAGILSKFSTGTSRWTQLVARRGPGCKNP
jgi:hypothetical protein